MVVNNFNLDTLRARTFKGWVQFEDVSTPGTYYRLKERQTMSVVLDYIMDGHYSDDGVKNVDPAGHNHRFNMNLKLTLDLFDDVFSASSDDQTLSYWVYQLEQHNPLTITFASIVATMGNIAGDTHLQLVFKLVPSTFGPFVYSDSGGSVEMSLSGEIIAVTSLTRENSASILQ